MRHAPALLPTSWWATSGPLCLDRDGRVYSAALRWACVGHIDDGFPAGRLHARLERDWDWLAAEWREHAIEDIEAEDHRQFALALGGLK